MTLKSYEVHNWGPHRHQTLDFPSHAKTIALCAENDQGKTWILRGIGFTLSIGRNEYGDQTSIHAGETEAHHKLCFEHNKKTYTLEKIVRNKTSENEGTLTFIDGQPADKAKLEEFYTQTLGLPLPSVWLPLTISMQNQTDFHLRSKKSEREEALRAACQLTRIDNWKDALQTKTNEVEKRLLTHGANLEGRLMHLCQEEEKIKGERLSLEGTLTALHQPIPNSPKTLSEILKDLTALEESEKRAQKTKLEKITQQRTFDLLATTLQRLERELFELTPKSLTSEDEIKLEVQREEALAQLDILKKQQLLEKIKRATLKLTEKLKALEKNPAPPKPEILDLKSKIQAAQNLSTSLQEKCAQRAELKSQLHFPDTSTPQLQEQLEDKDQKISELLALQNAQTLAKNAFAPYFGGIQTLQEGEIKLQEAARTAISPNKLNTKSLQLHLIENWATHPKNCPLCQQNLSLSPLQDSTRRQTLHQTLEKELAKPSPTAEVSPSEIPLEHLQTHLRLWRDAENTLKNLVPHPDLTQALLTLKQNSKSLLKDLILNKQISSHSQQIQTLQNELNTLLKNQPLSSLEDQLARLLEKETHFQLSSLEIQHLQKEIEGLEKDLEELPQTPLETLGVGPASTSREALQEKIQELTKQLGELRKIKHLKTTKEKELQAQTLQLKSTQQILARLEKDLAQEETLQNQLETPTPPCLKMPNPSETEKRLGWAKMLEEKHKTQHLLEEIPPKLAQKQTEITNLKKHLEEINRQKAQTQAARKLIQFLDYKNAPRKLLQNITEKIFHTTNQLGEHFDIGVKIHTGKNLEFLTKQKRNGRIVEQKTEKLGFGKGAVLGICFRLACQKLLLPETGFLLLDEPTANIDLKRKAALKSFLQNLSEESQSGTKQVLLIEHDLDVIELCQAKIPIGEAPANYA